MSTPSAPHTPTTAAAGPAASGTPQQLNQIVMEYLSKKGYSKTEAMLRSESAHTDADGRPIISSPEEYPETMYEKAYSHLRRWIDNSLDIYKPELRRLVFPIFVHFYMNLIHTGNMSPGKSFWNNHHDEHEGLYGEDLKELSILLLPAHVDENKLAKLYRENKYRVGLSQTSKSLLLHFLEETSDQGGGTVLKVINSYIDLKTVGGKPGMFGRDEDSMRGEEGIAGHISERSDTSRTLPTLKLGPLPMDKDFEKDVEDELKELDAKESSETTVAGASTLHEEFQKIKREENEDSPMREMVPLPPYTAADIDREIRMVKESRESLKMEGKTGPILPTVHMYTFHNTNDGLNCLDFSEDVSLVVGGFSESYIRIWSLRGLPLESIIPTENQPGAPKSRRLIGHSGPVYGVSFSPNGKYLLSCSEDKSTRLWSLDTFTGLVVYKGHDAPVWDVEFGPYGHYFATASHENTARLWSCDHIYPLRIFAGHLSDVDTVKFHPNSAYIFTGSSDKTSRMWDIQTGNSVRLFSGHTAPVSTLAVSPNGRYLATASEDSLIAIWDIAAGKRLKVMRGHGKTSIYSLSFSQEGNVLVSAGADMTVRTWDVLYGTGTQTAEVPESMNGTNTASLPIIGDGTSKVDTQIPTKRRVGKDVVAT